MPSYICPRCNKNFRQRGDIRRHFLRKNPCLVVDKNVEINQCFLDILGEENPNYLKVTPNDSSGPKSDSKMTPPGQKVTPIDSFLLKSDSKMTPNYLKMNPNDSFSFCKNKKKNKKTNKKQYICNFCKKQYSKNSNLCRHQKKCKKKDSILIKHMSEQIKHLEKEKESMRKQHALEVKDLLSKVGNVTNITNNTQQNIFINSYGSENLAYITKNYLKNLIKMPFGAVPKLIKDIHFHKEHPENKNVKITNKKFPYVSIYKDNKWSLYDKKQVLETMVDAGYNILDLHYEKDKSQLTLSQNGRFKDFQKKYENSDNKLKKQLVKDTELTILNES